MSDSESLRCDVGQILWIGFHGTRLPAETSRTLRAGDAGAVILFRRNLVEAHRVFDVGELVALTTSIRGAAPDSGEPVLIAVDQEGGRVQRIRAPGTVWPPMLQFERVDDAVAQALAEQVGRAIGEELAAVGIDVDFAPVLDVHTNPANPIIGDRAFATSAQGAATRALALARGLEAAGIIGCGKHFPGHGDTATD